MKRCLHLCLLLGGMALSLSGCQIRVSWFGAHTYVPWYFVVVPVVIILVVPHMVIIRHTYRCPKCGHIFRPRWCAFSAWLYYGRKRVVKCPRCGYKGFCEIDS